MAKYSPCLKTAVIGTKAARLGLDKLLSVPVLPPGHSGVTPQASSPPLTPSSCSSTKSSKSRPGWKTPRKTPSSQLPLEVRHLSTSLNQSIYIHKSLLTKDDIINQLSSGKIYLKFVHFSLILSIRVKCQNCYEPGIVWFGHNLVLSASQKLLVVFIQN